MPPAKPHSLSLTPPSLPAPTETPTAPAINCSVAARRSPISATGRSLTQVAVRPIATMADLSDFSYVGGSALPKLKNVQVGSRTGGVFASFTLLVGQEHLEGVGTELELCRHAGEPQPSAVFLLMGHQEAQ